MLNYIQAEFYKLFRRKYTYIALGGLLVLEALFASMFAFHNSHAFAAPFADAVVSIVELGSIGFCTCMFTGDIVFAGQYKNSTLKNEVSFGLSRTRIYLGKLIAQTLLSILYMVVMMGFFLALCAIVLPHDPQFAISEGFIGDTGALQIVGYFLAVGLPLWVGAQAALCMCLFLIHSDMAASFAYLGIIFGANTVLELTGLLIRGGAGETLLKICGYLPAPLLDGAKAVVGSWAYLGKAWLVGAFWVAASTAAGLYGFHRKEIK